MTKIWNFLRFVEKPLATPPLLIRSIQLEMLAKWTRKTKHAQNSSSHHPNNNFRVNHLKTSNVFEYQLPVDLSIWDLLNFQIISRTNLVIEPEMFHTQQFQIKLQRPMQTQSKYVSPFPIFQGMQIASIGRLKMCYDGTWKLLTEPMQNQWTVHLERNGCSLRDENFPRIVKIEHAYQML